MHTDEILERLGRIEAALAAPEREFLDVARSADFLGLSKQQLDIWRTKGGGGPAFHKVGRRVLYGVTDLRSFMSEHRVRPLQ